MFAMFFAIVIAVMIDRLCSRHRISSTPYQFASLGMALVGDLSVIGVLNLFFPRPVKKPIELDNMTAEIIGWTIATLSGMAGSTLVYLLVRWRLLRNTDYDDLGVARRESDIADIEQPRDGDDFSPRDE